MSLPYQLVLVEEMEIPVFVWWEMRNKKKEIILAPGRFHFAFAPRPPFREK